MYLPGRTKPPKLGLNGEVKQENGRVKQKYSSENEDDDDVELVSQGGRGCLELQMSKHTHGGMKMMSKVKMMNRKI